MAQDTLDFNLGTCLETTIERLVDQAAVRHIELVMLVHQSAPIALQGDFLGLQQILTAAIEWAIALPTVQTVFVLATQGQPATPSSAIPSSVLLSVFAIETETTLSDLLRSGSCAEGAAPQLSSTLPALQQSIEALGGGAGLTTQPGQYSRLWLSLPLQPSPRQPQPSASTQLCQKCRLLLIDRPSLSGQVLSYEAARFGVEVSKAASVDAALLLQHQSVHPPNMIIAGAGLPAIDRLCHAQRMNPALAIVPLVLLTDCSLTHWEQQTLNLQAVDASQATSVLPKPIYPSKLRQLLDKVCCLDTPSSLVDRPKESEQAKRNLANLKVLLVEDNLINQKITLKQLSSLGCTVDVAAHGLEAVAAVAQTSYDIVLMDCQMPLLDGYSATEQIRIMEQQEFQHRRPTVIIAITANTLKEDRERAIAAGMNDYLSKPVSHKVLTRTIEQWSQRMPTMQPLLDTPTATINRLRQQIDWEHLHRLSDDSTEFEWELLQIFVADSQDCLNKLKPAIAALDYEQIEMGAHHLNGASANIGATVMQAAAAQLEHQARLRQLQDSDRLLSDLEASLCQIQALSQLGMRDEG